ncbi:hypothetical protein [Novosphingobium sp.]|uniref:hypothetical protein n=1 Tax=Novosphingobium sp. TaxID=1874826 RepID=UPI0035B4CF2F
MKAATQRLLVLLTLAVWIASLCFQTLTTSFFSQNGDAPLGWTLLEWGWTGLLAGYLDWLANPILLVVLMWVWIGGLHRTIGLAMIVFLFLTVIANLTRSEILANEAGSTEPITHWYAGFYLWLVSLGLAAILGAVRFKQSSKSILPSRNEFKA